MEQYSFIIPRRFYPGHTEVIEPQLPPTYVSDTSSRVPPTENCKNCFFNQSGQCTYWSAPIRDNYWCEKWTNTNSLAVNLPKSPPCLTGFTIPILLSEDFNDIGVYTPFDGLVLQRDVVNNFVYKGTGLTVEVFNTSDIEFKRFLTFGNYTIGWGDTTSSTLTLGALSATHNYPASGTYKISLQQVNPWGTTLIEKEISVPYTSQVNIVNPFGVVSIHPPNLGDPIACTSIYQSYIFSGDSNPDVYDYFTFTQIPVPFPVTGYTTNSRLSLLTQYGPNVLPLTGQTLPLVENLEGEILEVSPEYTAYTINNITYTDFKNSTTYFEALSTGWNPYNLEWECCDEVATDECKCEEFGDTIPSGEWDTLTTYMRTATVFYNDCCWYCAPQRQTLLECNGVPSLESSLWLACSPCGDAIPAHTQCESLSIGPYNSNVSLSIGDVVLFNNMYYTYEGPIVGAQPSVSVNLTYMDVTGAVTDYVDNYGVWSTGYSTHPLFDWVDWETQSQQSIDTVNYTLWSPCE